MDVSADMHPAPAPRGLRLAAMIGAGGLCAWLMFSAYQAPATRECQRRYHQATTARDRALVDALVPDVRGNRGPEAHSCGFFRTAARWAP